MNNMAAAYRTFRCLTTSYTLSNYYRRVLSSNVKKKSLVHLKDGMKVHELAAKLKTDNDSVLKVLRTLGEQHVAKTTRLSLNISELVAMEMEFIPKTTSKSQRIITSANNFRPCPPVVTVMGHVDHGKTSLLDAIRKTSVASTEAGGITQHIGAFSVLLSSGKRITFLDTPGHAAFSSMRARGANMTNIIVLVVAADDGVMPQTLESIKMAQDARVPIVVAINKCDKHDKDVARVKNQLLQHSIQLEEFGGDVQAVELSAATGQGIDALEEAIIAQAEVCDLVADPHGAVEGVVIESRTDKRRGHTATILIQQGTLRCGCILVSGMGWAKIRSLMNERGQIVEDATPSIPVLTTGWRELPEAGEKCLQVDKESEAVQIINRRKTTHQKKQELLKLKSKFSTGVSDETKVPLIVKGDVWGSVDALIGILRSKQPGQLKLSIVHTGVGGVSDSDVEMASSTGGLILAFNVSSSKATSKLALHKDVTILHHNVIYKLLESLNEYLERQLPMVEEEEIIGEAVVLKVFKLKGKDAPVIGGCRVKKGQLVSNAFYQVWRGEELVYEGTLLQMKRGKENITTAKKETECGLNLKKNADWEEGDRVVCLKRNKVAQKLNWNVGF